MPRESTLESKLFRHTSLSPGTPPDRITRVIDIGTGEVKPMGRLPRHPGHLQFPPDWLEEMHGLLMMFVNTRGWTDLIAFFRRADYVPSSGTSWPSVKIEKVAEKWREYRDITRDILLGRSLAAYPKELREREQRMLYEKKDRGELYDPLDLMWIAHTQVLIREDWRAERLKGSRRQRYALCKTGCGRFVPAPWPPPKGPTPRYCDRCNGRVRDLAGHKNRKTKRDDECREILWKAFKALPASERQFRNQRQRMAVARKLYKKIRKQLAEIPGTRGERWIAKQLKKGEGDGQN